MNTKKRTQIVVSFFIIVSFLGDPCVPSWPAKHLAPDSAFSKPQEKKAAVETSIFIPPETLINHHKKVEERTIQALANVAQQGKTFFTVDISDSYRTVEEGIDSDESEMVFILKPGPENLSITLPLVFERMSKFGYTVSHIQAWVGKEGSAANQDLEQRLGKNYHANALFAQHGEEVLTAQERERINQTFDTPGFKEKFGVEPHHVPVIGLKQFEAIVRESGDSRKPQEIVAAFYDQLTPDLIFSSDPQKKWQGLVSIGQSKNVLARKYNGQVYFFANSHYAALKEMFLSNGRTSVFMVLKKIKGFPSTWETMRKKFLGGGKGGKPEASLPGSLRRDAWEGLLGPMFRCDAIYNLGHLSASPLEAANELNIWFPNIPSTFFNRLIQAGYPRPQIEFLLSNPPLYVGNRAVSLFELLSHQDTSAALDLLLKVFPPFFEDGIRSPSISFEDFLELQRAYQRGAMGLHTNTLEGEVDLPRGEIYRKPVEREGNKILLVGSPEMDLEGIARSVHQKLGGQYALICVKDVLEEAAKGDSDLASQLQQGQVSLQKFNNVLLRHLQGLKDKNAIPSNNAILVADPSIIHFPFELADFLPSRVLIVGPEPAAVNEAEQTPAAKILTDHFKIKGVPVAVLPPPVEATASSWIKLIQREITTSGESIGHWNLVDMPVDATPSGFFAEALRQGKIARIRPIAGTGSRFFPKGAKIPENERVKGLAPVGKIDGRPVPAAALAILHDRAVCRQYGGQLPQYICTRRDQQPAIERALRAWGITDVHYFVVNDIPRLTPFAPEAQAGKKPIAATHKEIPPGEILRFADTAAPSQKNVGHLDTLASLALSGQLIQMIQDGIEMVYVANGEDLGGRLVPELFNLLAQQPEKEMLVTVLEPDQFFEIVDAAASSKEPLTTVIVRRCKGESQIIKGHENKTLAQKGWAVRLASDVSIEVIDEKTGKVVPASQAKVTRKIETGGVLLSVNGKDRIVEKMAVPASFNTHQPLLLNTNQMILKMQAILKLCGFHSAQEAQTLWEKNRKEYVRRVREALKKFKSYVEIKDVLNFQDQPMSETTALVQFSRLIGDSTAELDVLWVFKARDAQEDGLGGYYNLKVPSDVDEMRQPFQAMIHFTGLPTGNLRQENGESIEQLIEVDGDTLIFYDPSGAKEKEWNLKNIGEEDYLKAVQRIIKIKLSRSRFPETHKKLMLNNAVFDFVGEGLVPELNLKWLQYQQKRAQEILRSIYLFPETRKAFLRYLMNYTVIISFENVSTPIYLVILNVLKGRPLTDRSIVAQLRGKKNGWEQFLAENETLARNPIFGDRLPGAKWPELAVSLDSTQPGDKTARILAFAAGEKVGPRQELDLFRKLLKELAPDTKAEISAYDIHYPESIHAFDPQGRFVGQQRVYPFDENGWYQDPVRQIRFRKLNIQNPADNITLETYEVPPEEKYDIVYDSRMAVWYNNRPELYPIILRNLLKHVQPGGILLHDTPAADILEVWKVNLDGSYELAGVLPYEDVEISRKNINRIIGRFITLSDEDKENIEKAYSLCSAYVSVGNPIITHSVMASFAALITQDMALTLAILLQHVPAEVIKSTFAGTLGDKIVEKVKCLPTQPLDYHTFSYYLHAYLLPFYRAGKLLEVGKNINNALLNEETTPFFSYGQIKIWFLQGENKIPTIAIETAPDAVYYYQIQTQPEPVTPSAAGDIPSLEQKCSAGAAVEVSI